MSPVSRLSKLFGSSAARPVARKARLGVEALGDRVVPSVSFDEYVASHTLTVTGTDQSNTVAIRNDGDGNLTVTGDGVTRTFAHITHLDVRTLKGADTVTYTQGSAGHEADTHRSFYLDADLGGPYGDTDTAGERFTADVFGDVGVYRDGAWQARTLSLDVSGDRGADRFDFRFHDTDVHRGSTLDVTAAGGRGDNAVTLDMDGEVDGKVALDITTLNGDDSIAVTILLDAGSTGKVGDSGLFSAAAVRSDAGNDHLLFAVRQAAGSHARVYALEDGGISPPMWPDNDSGQHTANVRTAWLEHDTVIT
jgi:hypothetical protein